MQEPEAPQQPVEPMEAEALPQPPQSIASTADHQPQPTFRPPLTAASGAVRARPALTGMAQSPSVDTAPQPVPASAMSRPTVPTPPSVTAQPLIERQTPRAEMREEPRQEMPTPQAMAQPQASPLPKRTPRAPLRTNPSSTTGALGSAEIYYGAPGSAGSPQVPRDLAQMETIGSGD